VDEIIRAADVCKGNFYYHFSSKTELGLAVIDAWVAQYDEHVVGPALADWLEPVERLERFVDATVEAQRDNGYIGCPLGRMALEMGDLDEAFRARLELAFDGWCARLAQVLAEGGSSRPREEACFLMASLEGALLLTKVQAGGSGLECVAEQLKTLVRDRLAEPVLQ
jgi:TetR/AcrR family transcriptional repressor of nem operon